MFPRPYDIDSLDNRNLDAIEWAVNFVERTLVPYHRAKVDGVERIPNGPALYVGNHNSLNYAPEMYLLGWAAFRAHGLSAAPYGLTHEFMISIPGVNQLICPLGAVRASHHNGERILQSGHKALVFPGGDLDTGRPYRDRNRIVFGGRKGYIRLALKTGVPIIPVVTAGAHATVMIFDDMRWLARALGAERFLRIKIWPLMLSMPWGLTLGAPPGFIPFPSRILMEVLEPIHFERTGPEAAADPEWVDVCDAQVQHVMQQALTRLAAKRSREPV